MTNPRDMARAVPVLGAEELARLVSKVDRRGDDECWPWTGALIGEPTHRYGSMWVWEGGRRNYYAHRLMYRQFVGPIPDGHVVRHKCDNPWCVNPNHLEAGTHRQNMHDMSARGRGNGRFATAKPGHREIRTPAFRANPVRATIADLTKENDGLKKMVAVLYAALVLKARVG